MLAIGQYSIVLVVVCSSAHIFDSTNAIQSQGGARKPPEPKFGFMNGFEPLKNTKMLKINRMPESYWQIYAIYVEISSDL